MKDALNKKKSGRPQINRNQGDFVHGNSGQTIDIDEASVDS